MINKIERVIHPASLEEALELLSADPAVTAVCAGGSDLFAGKKTASAGPKKKLLCIGGLPSLRAVRLEEDGLHVSACCTFAQIIESREVTVCAPLLAEASVRVASPQIRNVATLGGNVCNASPAADGLTALVCLGAAAVLRRVEGNRITSRRLQVEELVTGPGETGLYPGELLTEFIIPVGRGGYYVYEKVGLRSAMAIAVLSIALTVDLDDGIKVRAAFGSLGPRVVTSSRAEELAASGRLDEAIQSWLQSISPMDDLRASADYRRLSTEKLLRRYLYDLPWKPGKGGG